MDTGVNNNAKRPSSSKLPRSCLSLEQLNSVRAQDRLWYRLRQQRLAEAELNAQKLRLRRAEQAAQQKVYEDEHRLLLQHKRQLFDNHQSQPMSASPPIRTGPTSSSHNRYQVCEQWKRR